MHDDSLGTMSLSESKAYELLEELELTSPTTVRKVREKVTVPVDAAIEVRPADIIRRPTVLIEGSARKLATLGVSAICDRPVEVGSVYYLTFDQAALDLAPILGVCDKCVMLEPTVFGVHFQFPHAIELPPTARGSAQAMN